MTVGRFERMVGIPEDEYLHLKSLQQVNNPLQGHFQSLVKDYNNQELISDAFSRNQRQGETLNSMLKIKDEMREHIMQVTPKPYQTRAGSLYKFVSNKININEKGELIDNDGMAVVGSNISDLIQHAVRDRRRNITPPGWDYFVNILKDNNSPRMILNYETLEEMHGSTAMKTPSSTKIPMSKKSISISPQKHGSPSLTKLPLSESRIRLGPYRKRKQIEGNRENRKRKIAKPSYLDNYYLGSP
ncbi:MAG: hypothetical protein AAGK05_05190 [Pseudomonadota bacterium]